jgi:hypothetical protein
LQALDRQRHRPIDALQCAGYHGRTDIRLVVVRADGVPLRVVRGIDVAGGAAARDFKENIGAGRDLRDAQLLAKRRFLGVRVGNFEGYARVGIAGAGDEARDIGIDGGPVVRAKDSQYVMAGAADFLFFHQAGDGADQVGGLLLLEQQVGHIGERGFLAIVIDRCRIDQRKFLPGVLLCRVPQGAGHVGRDSDDQCRLGGDAALQAG